MKFNPPPQAQEQSGPPSAVIVGNVYVAKGYNSMSGDAMLAMFRKEDSYA